MKDKCSPPLIQFFIETKIENAKVNSVFQKKDCLTFKLTMLYPTDIVKMQGCWNIRKVVKFSWLLCCRVQISIRPATLRTHDRVNNLVVIQLLYVFYF